jgi:hypothetical protein
MNLANQFHTLSLYLPNFWQDNERVPGETEGAAARTRA